MNKQRNWMLRQAAEALRKDNKHFFLYGEDIVIYFPSRTMACERKIRPYYVKVMITAAEDGLLIRASVPVRLSGDQDAQNRLLRAVAQENYGKIRGGLIYHPQEGRLVYQIYVAVSAQDRDCLNTEVKRCTSIAARELSDGYCSVVNALDEQAEAEDADDKGELAAMQAVERDLREWLRRHSEDSQAGDAQPDEDEPEDSDDELSVSDEEMHTQLVSLLESLLDEEEEEGEA